MATLGTTALVAFTSTRGGKKTDTPPIKAESSDEEKYIKDFLAKMEAEDNKAKH
ncbi:hypothetical protein EDC01DRAFT_782668 [Geopyxis carbonaria]|nr:hypothetical protein EDC01DRAFT_782668 [Geopyxis carbonaria]